MSTPIEVGTGTTLQGLLQHFERQGVSPRDVRFRVDRESSAPHPLAPYTDRVIAFEVARSKARVTR